MIAIFFIIGGTMFLSGLGSTCWLLGAEFQRSRTAKYIALLEAHDSLPE